MADQCGDRSTNLIIGDICCLSMDLSSISELVHHRIGEGASARVVKTVPYFDFHAYDQQRSARQRLFAPIPARKMDVESCAGQQQQQQQQDVPCLWVEFSWDVFWKMVSVCNT